MNSMTGYGRGVASLGDKRLVIELSSVNRKNLEIQWNAPRELDPIEPKVRDWIGQVLSRGRLTGKANWEGDTVTKSKQTSPRKSGRAMSGVPVIHEDTLQAYLNEWERIQDVVNFPDKFEAHLSLSTLLRLPGVVSMEEPELDLEELTPLVEEALNAALKELSKMRAREGQALKKEMKARSREMQKVLKKIEKNAPQVLENYRSKLQERIAKAGIEPPGEDDERLLREIVYFADRSDITEEITRLKSHFQQLDDCFNDSQPVGRKLDFLAQEFNREINTIGSKANDASIATDVVFLKTELEKLREQFQNVE